MKLPAFLSRIVDLWRQPGERRVYLPPRQAGVSVTEDTAMTLAEWWACVSVISRTVASLPWGVYERTENGRREMFSGVSWLLNNQPNPEMGAFSFREALVAHALNWGNGYAEIQRDLSNRPVYLWLLTPDRVTPKRRQSTGELYYEVRNDDGALTELEPSQVLHLHGLGFDGVTGYSIVQMAARSIGIGIAQDTFAGSFYQNGTVYGRLIKVAGTTRPEQIEQLERYYNENAKGPASAFGVKVAPAGTEVETMGMPLTDAQFVESRQLTTTMAARWLGVPPHKIADLTRSTNNNIEHQGIEFVTDAIVPWAMRLEQEADGKLFGLRSQGRIYTKLTVNALMRGDSKSRAEFYRAMTQIGAMSINEVRTLEELNGIGPAGDKHLVQLNQTTLEHLVKNPGAKDDTSSEPAVATVMQAMNAGHAANAESVIGALSRVSQAVANLALKEQPVPVFNMHSPAVTVNQGDVHLGDGMVKLQAHIETPQVQNHVHVEPAAITMNAGDVNLPEGCITLDAHIETPQVQNYVTVAPANIDVHPAMVNMQPADVHVHQSEITVHPAAVTVQPAAVNVHVPQALAPVVNVHPELKPTDVIVQNHVPPALVNVTARMPARKTESETEIDRDSNGNIIRSVTNALETDA